MKEIRRITVVRDREGNDSCVSHKVTQFETIAEAVDSLFDYEVLRILNREMERRAVEFTRESIKRSLGRGQGESL